MPGNKCSSGLDLNPTVYSCSATSILSLKVFMSLIIIGAILYFGWPMFEALLIALPIPDPKDVKDKVRNLFKSQEPQGKVKKDQYTKNFNQTPESLGESSDEEDAPVKASGSASHLRYDSDEDKDGLGDSELINLDDGSSTKNNRDRTNTAAEKIPKLKRPPQ